MFARITFLPSLAYNLARNRWTTWNWFDRIDETIVLGALPFHGPVTRKLLVDENIRAVISMNEDFEIRYAVTNGEHWRRLGVTFLQLCTADIFHSPSQEKLDRGVQFILDHQRRTRQKSLHENQNYPDNDIDDIDERPRDPATIERISKQIYDNEYFTIPWSIRNDGQWLSMNENESPQTNIINNNNNNNENDTTSSASSSSSIVSIGANPRSPSIYVHCKAGRTRSATLVACYLIKRYSLTPVEAVRIVTERRPVVFLHTKQWQAIEQFYERHHDENDAAADAKVEEEAEESEIESEAEQEARTTTSFVQIK